MPPPEDDLLPEVLAAFAQSFEAAAVPLAGPLTLDAVRAFVAAQVARLLDRNPALLMHVLYRVDVAERDVQQVFAEAAPAAVPLRLADLLVERQLQKLRLRRTYRSPDG